jgi:NAD(P)-dependent dehydrogenase (short-subunit alcohol dehydrogenase family)
MDGRVALITGSSRGLGRAMALEFAASGAHVCLVARREDVLNETREEVDVAGEGKVCAVVADVGKAEEMQRVRRMPFEEITDELWEMDLELKLFAAIRATRLVFPGMKQRRWGRIINVLNTGAKAPPAGGAPTAVSRAAGMALTKVLAGEGAPHNVLVNAMLVGRIESDQWHTRWQDGDQSQSYEEYLADMARDLKLPMGRLGTAGEFANLACFLCSDAGSYINGCAINVDGGMSPVV